MRKNKKILFSLMFLCFWMAISFSHVQATNHDEQQLEEFIKGNNYRLADEAIEEFMEAQEKQISLPEALPFEPTHCFGKITNEGHLKLHYMIPGESEEQPTVDFIIYVMPEMDLDVFISSDDKEISLEENEKVYYRKHHERLHTMVYKKKDYGYHFGGEPSEVTFDELLEAASSIK